jgi:methylenetetrahydrofolate reductase (NADPH)
MGDLHQTIQTLGTFASIEIQPATVGSIDWADPSWKIHRRVYLTDTSKPYGDHANQKRTGTVNAAKILGEHGMIAVPHIAARRVKSQTHLLDLVTRLQDVGVQDVLLVGGSLTTPAGPYYSTKELINTGIFDDFRSVAFAAHPAGNPVSSPQETAEALKWKNDYAKQHPDQKVMLVTQLCFNPQTLVNWTANLRSQGNSLPVYAGITGPASLTQKFDYARMCGLGSAFNIVRAQGANIFGLLQTTPSKLITSLADAQNDMEAPLINGLHFYTFNNAARTAQFVKNLSQGGFSIKGDNFTLECEPG